MTSGGVIERPTFGRNCILPMSMFRKKHINLITEPRKQLQEFKNDIASIAHIMSVYNVKYFALPKIGILYNVVLEYIFQSLKVIYNISIEPKSDDWVVCTESCMCSREQLSVVRPRLCSVHAQYMNFNTWSGELLDVPTTFSQEINLLTTHFCRDFLHEADHAQGTLKRRIELSRTLLGAKPEDI